MKVIQQIADRHLSIKLKEWANKECISVSDGIYDLMLAAYKEGLKAGIKLGNNKARKAYKRGFKDGDKVGWAVEWEKYYADREDRKHAERIALSYAAAGSTPVSGGSPYTQNFLGNIDTKANIKYMCGVCLCGVCFPKGKNAKP